MGQSSLKRIIELDRMIQLGRMTSTRQAAQDLEVSRRTIERDLETLREDFGAEPVYNRQRKCYEYSGKAFPLPAQWLDRNEIALILIAEKALRIYTHTGFADEVHPAFNRFLNPIRSHEDVMEHIRELCKSVYFYRSFEPVRGLRKEFSIVVSAIMDRKRLSLEYASARHVAGSRRQLEPYTLINNNGIWHVVGRCLRERKIKTFALDRIYEPVIEDYFFEVPDEYDPFEYFHHQFETLQKKKPVEIKLKIFPSTASYIKEVLWHPTQKVKEDKHGSIILTMQCNITNHLIKWILQMAEDVVILQPEELKNKVVKKVERMLERNRN